MPAAAKAARIEALARCRSKACASSLGSAFMGADLAALAVPHLSITEAPSG